MIFLYWIEVWRFHWRFRKFRGGEVMATLPEQWKVFDEEVREFKDDVFFANDHHRLCGEAADVLFTMIGVLHARKVNWFVFLWALIRTLIKNNRKKPGNYIIDKAGKIRRKPDA